MNANKREFAILCIVASGLFAQTQEDHSHFEVASIKPSLPGVALSYTGPNTGDPGRIAWSRISLRELIQAAYDDAYSEYKGYRVEISGPAWLHDQYQVTAKIPSGSTSKDVNQMLRNQVIERFALKFHDRSKDAPGFDLVAGEGGFKVPALDQDQPGFPVLGSDYSWRTAYDRQLGVVRASFRQCSMKGLANMLSLTYTEASILVIDKTEIDGRYDFHLILPIPSVTILPPALAARMPSYSPPDDPGVDLRGISGALEKQTGLKLKSEAIASNDGDRQCCPDVDRELGRQ
jgi:uncharacterized protein (TIGR03435 family)